MSLPARPQAILFDLGHTLLDFAEDEAVLAESYERIRGHLIDELAAEVEVPDVAALVAGLSARMRDAIVASYEQEVLQELDMEALYVDLCHDLGLTVEPAVAREIVTLEHAALSAAMRIGPDTLDVLDRLVGAGMRVGIVSNFTDPGDLLREDLDALGIGSRVERAIFSADTGVRKPDPAIYRAVLEPMSLDPGRCVFVGDRVREDIVGPQSLGLAAILTHEFRDEAPGGSEDAVIARLADLPAALGLDAAAGAGG